MSNQEQSYKRILHYAHYLPLYQPGTKVLNEHFREFIKSLIENIATNGDVALATNCVVKAFSDGYSAHPSMLIYALAVCAKQDISERLREDAYKAMKTVCSSSENLFLFIKYAKSLSQNNSIWGNGFRKVCKEWYLKKELKTLAEIIGKQKKHHGWSHKDVIKLIHLKPDSPGRAALIKYILFDIKTAKKDFKDSSEANEILNYLQILEDFKHSTDKQQAARSIETHQLKLEHVPSHLLKSKEVWSALIGNIPLPVLLSKLQKIGYLGFLKPHSFILKKVLQALSDETAIAESHLHPATVYFVLCNYESQSKYLASKKHVANRSVPVPPQPNPKIISALHSLFNSTCKLFLAPTGLKYMVFIHLKNLSLTAQCHKCPHVSPVQAAALTTLCLLHAEGNVSIRVSNGKELLPIALNSNMTMSEVIKKLQQTEMHQIKDVTPLSWALEKKEKYDVFVIITDVFSKGIANACKDFQKYKKDMDLPNTKLVSVLLKYELQSLRAEDKIMQEPGMFTIGGFDEKVPRIIEAFSRGAF